MKTSLHIAALLFPTFLFGQIDGLTSDAQKIVDREIAARKKGDESQLENIPEKYSNLKNVSIVYEGAETYYIHFRIINNSKKAISFLGYGISNPIYRIQIKDKGAWIDPKRGGVCGTGLGVSELPPGKSIAFQISKEENGLFRVGIDLLPESEHLTVWSEK